MSATARVAPVLPRLLLAASGPVAHRGQGPPPLLLRGTTLEALISVAASEPPLAVDLDSIGGLAADQAAAEFVVSMLGVRVVMTRRASLATAVAGAGGLCLVRVNSLDSTGLARFLAAPPAKGAGTVISPGIVLPYLPESARRQLPRPLVAYGLVRTSEEAELVFASGATTVVVRGEGVGHARRGGWGTSGVRATPG